jgi:nitrite reductase/ring-hydroxylating ferredoxin subunit/uncharacterized membrane protein
MKSKASFDGHPIHTVLNVFPLAFFVGAFVFDATGIISGRLQFWQTGKYLGIAGIISALIAAIPGAIDYVYTIPPNSSAKKRGLTHGLMNVSVVVLFVVSFFVRRGAAPLLVVVLIEAIGAILLCLAGFMGGTLVYRNQIGVYNRYADKGKWKEEVVNQVNGQWNVGKTDELKTDQMKLVHAGDKRIVIARTENGYVGFDDRCTHKGGSLAGGVMICGTVQCPWHGTQFDVTTGNVKAGPATEKINTYKVVTEGDTVYLIL